MSQNSQIVPRRTLAAYDPLTGIAVAMSHGNFTSRVSCSMCLWSLGLGYSRISRMLSLKRDKVSKFIGPKIRRGAQRVAIARAVKAKPYQPDTSLKLDKFIARLYRKSQLKRRNMLRTYLWRFLFVYKRSPTIQALVGCSKEHLMGHLESGFARGMDWCNYGRFWEIDHIVPCKIFDLSNQSQARRCFHFSNLRPCKTQANRAKSASIITCQPELLLQHANQISADRAPQKAIQNKNRLTPDQRSNAEQGTSKAIALGTPSAIISLATRLNQSGTPPPDLSRTLPGQPRTVIVS